MGTEGSSLKIRCIVLDFDGTLAELRLDFAEMKRRIAVLAARHLGFRPPIPPTPALEWVESLTPDDAGVFKAEAAELIKGMELESAQNGRLFPFTRPLLEMLHSRGVKTAIITRNCEEAVRMVFPDIEAYCSAFLARNNVHRVKPDPGHLLHALRSLAIPPESALMVGDHPLDMETGRRAGVRTAGVWSGNATREDLIRSGAHWTARNCQELMGMPDLQALIP
jgi:phosphoglycolate phosphatase